MRYNEVQYLFCGFPLSFLSIILQGYTNVYTFIDINFQDSGIE